MIVPPTQYSPWIVRLFFGLLILVGLGVYRDYGVSTDEVVHHLNGIVNVKYIGQRLAPELAQRQASYATIPELKGYVDNDHGVIFEIPVAILSLLFAHHDSRVYYLMRHLLIFFTFVGGTWALFQLGKLRFQDWRWGLLGATLLVLSPRFFAEAFYNGMDIVFMAAFTVAMYTLVRLLHTPSLGRVLVHSLASAVAIDVRIVGLLLVGFTIALLGLALLSPTHPTRKAPAIYIRAALLYLALTAVFVVAGWPYLWEDPAGNFVTALTRMSRFPWLGQNLYFGHYLRGYETPWHYIPVWITLTTPVPYLVAATVGLLTCGLAVFRQQASFQSLAARLDVLLLSWLLVPLALIIGLHSSVYNGWRHLYFIYPALLLFAVHGIRRLYTLALRKPSWRRTVVVAGIIAGLEVAHTISWMVRVHPYQQAYFSFLPVATAETLFDRDYWGLSYRAGLEWILAHDASPQLIVSSPRIDLVYNNSLILPANQRRRLRIVYAEKERFDYLLTHYAKQNPKRDSALGKEIHTVYAGDLPILSVFQP